MVYSFEHKFILWKTLQNNLDITFIIIANISANIRLPFDQLKLTSHGILHYLRSADLLKSFRLLVDFNIYLFSIFFSIDFTRWKKLFVFSQYFFNRFCRQEKCEVTSHCLYFDSLHLSKHYHRALAWKWNWLSLGAFLWALLFEYYCEY